MKFDWLDLEILTNTVGNNALKTTSHPDVRPVSGITVRHLDQKLRMQLPTIAGKTVLKYF